MANATTLAKPNRAWAAILDTTATSQTLDLDPDKIYSVKHYGKDVNGKKDTTAVADRVADTDAFPLEAKEVFFTRRGMHQIKYINFGGAPQLHVLEATREFTGD